MRCFLSSSAMTARPLSPMILQALELPLDFGQLTLEPDVFQGHHAEIRKHGRGRRLSRDGGQEFRFLST